MSRLRAGILVGLALCATVGVAWCLRPRPQASPGPPPQAGEPDQAALPILFEDVLPRSGIDFQHQDGATPKHDVPEVMGGGSPGSTTTGTAGPTSSWSRAAPSRPQTRPPPRELPPANSTATRATAPCRRSRRPKLPRRDPRGRHRPERLADQLRLRRPARQGPTRPLRVPLPDPRPEELPPLSGTGSEGAGAADLRATPGTGGV